MGAHTLLLCLLASLVTPAAADPAAAFDQANKLYEQGNFAAAAQAYQEAIEQGHISAALYFNAGNAYFKSGQLGLSIAHFLRAEQLAPRDPDIRANLAFARDSVPGNPGRPLARWHSILSVLTLNELTVLAALTYWTWLSLLILRITKPPWQAALGKSARWSGLLFAVLLVWLAAAGLRHRSVIAVVISPEAVVRYGPLEESQSSFSLRDGAEVIVLDRKGNWLQVRDGSDRTGWLRENQVTAIQPGPHGPRGAS